MAMKDLLTVDDLTVHFNIRRGLLGRDRYTVKAVNGVSFTIGEQETLGLVGESGSGKSTVGKALLRLTDVTAGRILLDGVPVQDLKGRMLDYRRDLQVVFQDPYSSLNPSMIVSDIVGEPLTVHFGLKGKERDARVAELLDQVGLGSHLLERYPAEFSGGQRQRIAIARALALSPGLIVCDEPVSALDVSTQSQVINLLESLQARFGISYLFIAHDLAVVRHISDRIGVMYLGQLMELGPTERIIETPLHPYTRMLLTAIPVVDPVEQKRRKAERRLIPVTELPAPTNLPRGCPFHTRCPEVMDICRSTRPAPVPAATGGWVACHLYEGSRST